MVAATLRRLPAGACPAWTGSNHDVPRFTTRWCAGDERKIRLALLVLCTLRAPWSCITATRSAWRMWKFPTRDCWTDDLEHSGPVSPRQRPHADAVVPRSGRRLHAAGRRPWLPFGDYQARNVADQAQDPSSVLSLSRRLLEIRHQHLGPGVATYEEIPAPAQQWVYRTGPLVVAANFSDK